MKVFIGDITKVDADVIVNASDTDFTPGGGLARWIKKQGGKEIFEEAVKHAVGDLGKVYSTTAGKLNARAVYHIPTMDWGSDEKLPMASVHMSAIIAMDKAIKEGYKSIAFPLLGAGTVGLPEDEVAKEISDAILHIESETKGFEGYLVVLTKSAYDNMKNVLPENVEVIELDN